jgi:hypothetical protein
VPSRPNFGLVASSDRLANRCGWAWGCVLGDHPAVREPDEVHPLLTQHVAETRDGVGQGSEGHRCGELLGLAVPRQVPSHDAALLAQMVELGFP